MNVSPLKACISSPTFGNNKINPYENGYAQNMSNESIGAEIIDAASHDMFFNKAVRAERNGDKELADEYRAKSAFLLQISQQETEASKKLKENLGMKVRTYA
jgi:hypothetical protein